MAHNVRTTRAQRASRRPHRRFLRNTPVPASGARPYDRRTDLPRVLPLWPHELDDDSPQVRRRILCKLRCALRAERRRGLAGHWTYDLARHVELLRVYRLELAASGARDPGADPVRPAGLLRHIDAVQIPRPDH